MADRMYKRAIFYIANKKELWACTPKSLADCILAAGELGLCLDGKVAHAVKFNNKIKGQQGEPDKWVAIATMMADYKGILAVARRHNIIVDAYCEHVYTNDVFERSLVNGVWDLQYMPAKGDRGEYLGTFCCLVFPGNRFSVTYMTDAEIEHIRNKSKAKDDGPWVTDKPEMRRKTVFRRGLKVYVDDPEVLMLLDADDEGGPIDTTAEVVQEVGTALSRTQQVSSVLNRARGLPEPVEATDFSSMVGAGSDDREYEEVPRQQKEKPKRRQQEETRGEEVSEERRDDQEEPRRDRPQSSFTTARNRMVAAKSEDDMLAIYEQERPKLSEEDQHKLDEHKARLLKSFANSSVGQRSLPGADV
jgi:recombination protein RecT